MVAPRPNKAHQANTSTPLKFSLTSFVRPGAYNKEEYLNCEACRNEALELSERLFVEQAALRSALEGGLERVMCEVSIACFDPKGQFDHAVCYLRLNNLGPSRFLLHTSFYRGERLVATVTQHGMLTFPQDHAHA